MILSVTENVTVRVKIAMTLIVTFAIELTVLNNDIQFGFAL